MDLTSFLVQLAQDGELQQRYMADPVGTLTDVGLSEDDRATLLSGDQQRIKAALDPPLDDAFLIVCCFLIRN